MPVKAKTHFCIFSWKAATTCRFRLMHHLLSFGLTILPDSANADFCPDNSLQNHSNNLFGSPQPYLEMLTDGFRYAFRATFANTFLLHNFFNYLKFNMKNFTFTLAILLTFFSAFSQKGWVPFSSNQPQVPAVVIEQSNRSSVVFDVAIKEMFSEQLIQDGITLSGTPQANLIRKIAIC